MFLIYCRLCTLKSCLKQPVVPCPKTLSIPISLPCLTVRVQDFRRVISEKQKVFVIEKYYQANNAYEAPELGLAYKCVIDLTLVFKIKTNPPFKQSINS
jgi:hypothetical protein